MTKRRGFHYALRFAVAAIVSVLWVSGAVAQVGAKAGEVRAIVRISIDAPPSVDAVRVRELIRVREGERYDAQAVGRDVAVLRALGEFKEVRPEIKDTDGGVALIYHLVPMPRVAELRFEPDGQLDVSVQTLRELVTIVPDSLLNEWKLNEDKRAVLQRLHKEGYLDARVKVEITGPDEGVVVVYQITPGPKALIKAVKFEGNDAVPDHELRKVMMCIDEPGFFHKGSFDPALVQSDVLAVQQVVRDRGYLDALATQELIFDEADGSGYLLVRVRQGRLYKVSHLRIAEAKVFAADELASALGLRLGAPYALEQVTRDIAAIERMYGRRGYIEAQVKVLPTVSVEDAAVSVVLTVAEGSLVRVRKVLISGNSRTQDHVIRRNLTLLPGAVADVDGLDESRRRLERTRLFAADRAGKQAVRVEFADTEEPGLADVLVDVTQGPPGEAKLGGSWGTSGGLAGLLSLTLYDFDALEYPASWDDLIRGTAWRGGGQQLNLSLSPGTEYRYYSVNWKNPSVFDGPYFVGLSAYLRESIWDDYYDERRTGGSVTVGRRFGEYFEVSATPRVEYVEIHDLDSRAVFDARDVKGGHWRNSLIVKAMYDRRDNPDLTTEGYLLGASAELVGTMFGGDVDYVAEGLEARKWWTIWEQKDWGRHVVSIGGEVDAMQTTSADSIPIFDRRFMGGLGTLRGFRYRRAGVSDNTFNRQIGGEYRGLLNVEYEAPLYKNYVRGVVFVDSGIVERSVSALRFDAVRTSAGVGLRIRLPVFGTLVPISVFVAAPLQKEREDKTQVVNVSVGTGFAF